MTPEGRVKRDIRKILDGYKKAGHPVWYFMPVPHAHNGIPDFVICANRVFIGVEAKAGKGRMTALQERTLTEIAAAGGATLCVNEDRLQDLDLLIRNVLRLALVL